MVRIFCAAVLFALSAADIRTLEVPTAGLAALLGTVIIWVPPEEMAENLPACLLAVGCYLLTALICMFLKRPAPFGMGDAAVFGILALQLGMAGLFSVFALSGILAGFAAAVLLLLKKVRTDSQLPYVPFIAASYAACAVIGSKGTLWPPAGL